MGTQIDALTCGQLAAVPYGNHTPPSGWQIQGNYSDSSGNNAFTVIVNSSTHQIDFSFRGSENVSNFKSDLIDSGASEWESIKPIADSTFDQLMNGPYANYTPITTGHSLGGEDAAAFALDKGISGCGVNSLPIANSVMTSDFNSGTVNSWKNAGNLFSEYNNEGDPATFTYGLGSGTYINTSTTTLKTPYAACEEMGAELVLDGQVKLGTAMAAVCAYKAHSIDTEIQAAQNGFPVAQTGDTSQVDTLLASNMNSVMNDINSVTFTGSDSNPEVIDGSDYLDDLSVTSVSSNGDTYASNFDGYNLPLDAVTGNGGFTVNDIGAVIDVEGDNNNATVGASNDSIYQSGDYTNITMDGAYDSGYLDGGYSSISLVGYEEVAFANGYLDVIYYY